SRDYCADRAFSLRIDCALVPLLSADEELASDPARLARFGVFGCEAAGALAAITVGGRIAPCSFAPATGLPAGDIARHAGASDLSLWRAWVASPDEPCASCSLRSVCKGGCKVVSAFLARAPIGDPGNERSAPHGPDPECPRVVAHRSGSRTSGSRAAAP